MNRIVVIWLCMLTLGSGCGRGEIKGTYDVELRIAGVSQPLSGTLILSTLPLDIPTPTGTDPSIDSSWLGANAESANSCFIFSPTSPMREDGSNAPGVVRVFETRIVPGGIVTPIEILRATDFRIEISDLKFFADALGGELEIHTQNGDRPGRIHGSRVGAASSLRCTETLAAFREFLRDSSLGENSP